MRASEYASLDGVALADLIRTREVSRHEVAEAAAGVIEALNPAVNAVICMNSRASGPETSNAGDGRLWGVPFLLKDANLFSFDMPTTFGSAYFRGAVPRADSVMVDRWRKAGLAILGKTNTPEFAAEFVTEPQAYGATLNPHAPGLTVGGSSGGAAAAVAAGMVPIAHATDLGGSIRIPAACCGVFGFKPTAGLNPVAPYFREIAGGLNADHVVTRSVRDSAASLDITADARPGSRSYLNALNAPTGRLRIAVSSVDPTGRHAGPDQEQAIAEAAKLLERLGHELVEYAYPEDLNADWFDYLWISDIVQLVKERAREIGRAPHREDLEPLTWHLLEKAEAGGLQAYETAQASRALYARRYLTSVLNIDVLLTPTLAANPLPIGDLAFRSFRSVDAWNRAGYRFAPFSTPANIAGQPSASCPWFHNASGLSVGVQITGKPGADLLVLQLCAQLETATGRTSARPNAASTNSRSRTSGYPFPSARDQPPCRATAKRSAAIGHRSVRTA